MESKLTDIHTRREVDVLQLLARISARDKLVHVVTHADRERSGSRERGKERERGRKRRRQRRKSGSMNDNWVKNSVLTRTASFRSYLIDAKLQYLLDSRPQF